jgi:hypothetical protein
MLVIRRQQFDTFRAQLELQFEDEMASYLRRYFPFEAAQASLNLWVRQGLDKATQLGFSTRQECSLYLALMAMLGAGFDEDPQIPWAATGITNPDALSLQRITQVYERGIKYLEATGGPKCAWLVRAKLRARKHDMTVVDQGVHPRALPRRIRDVLAGLYPQKADVVGDAALELLVRFAIERTEAAGARTAAPALIHAVHMFFLGWSFDADPCYPWTAAALAGDAQGDVEERYRRMHEQSLDYLDRSFQCRV